MNRASWLVSCALLCLVPSSTLAGWVQVASPTGNTLRDIDAGVANSIVAVGDVGTILRSTDGGATWSSGAGPTTQDYISVCANGSHYRLGAIGGAMPQSFDAGLTWQFFGSNPSSDASVSFSKATSVSWVGTSAGSLYLTTNSGSSWATRISGPGRGLRAGAAIGQTSPGVVVGDGGAIWRTDDGTNWAPVASGSTADLRACEGLQPYAIAVGTGGTILTSDDAGQTWTSRVSGTTRTLNGVARFGSTVAYFVGDEGTVLRSDDAGLTWCPEALGTTADLFGVAEVAGEFVAVGEGGVLFRTVGGGNPCSPTAVGPGTQFGTVASLRLYPNPARGFAEAILEGPVPEGSLRIRVLDVAGRVVATEQTLEVSGSSAGFRVDTRNLPGGTYWVAVDNGAGFRVRTKFTVLR